MTSTRIGPVVFWMVGALLSFSAMAISIRGLANTLSIAEILTIRNAAGLIVLTALALIRPELRLSLKPRVMGLHFIRNVPHLIAQYSWALALTLLPLATVFALEFTTPALVAILAVLFLGERMTVSRIGSVIFGFIGALIILRPGMESFKPAALLVLIAALGFAVSVVATKKLTETVITFAVLFWMNAIQLPIALALSDPLFVFRITQSQILPLVGVAASGLASHYCLTNAFRSGDATVVVPLDFLRVPLIATVGWLFYNEPLDIFVFLGAGLIISGVLWNLRSELGRG